MAYETPRTSKSVDSVTKTWSNMSQVELDQYLAYDNVDADDQQLVTIPARTIKRKQGVIKRKSKLLHFSDLTVSLHKIEKGELKFRRPCPPLPGNIYHLRDDAFLELSIRMSAAFGSTVSPLLNSVIEAPNCSCGLYRDLLDTLPYTKFSSALEEAQDEMTDYFRHLFNDNIASQYIARLPRLRKLHSTMIAFKGVGFLRFLNFISYTALAIYHYYDVTYAITLFLVHLENCFTPLMDTTTTETTTIKSDDPLSDFKISPACQGFIILAPPSTGKTQFIRSLPFGFIDTDWLNSKAIDADPSIMTKLVREGFSIITNRWEWRQWNVPIYYIKPHDLKQSLNLKNSRREAGFERAKTEYLSSIRKVKPKILDRQQWFDKYDGVEEKCQVIALRATQSLIHGFSILTDLFLSNK